MKNYREKFNQWFTRLEIIGHHAANKAHRYFINMILLFMGYNICVFVVNYNNYWRLRRDPNIPKEWLAEESETRSGAADWKIERERIEREARLNNMVVQSGGKTNKTGFYE